MTTPQVLDHDLRTAEPEQDTGPEWLLDPRAAELKPEGTSAKRGRRARKSMPVPDRTFD